MSRQIYVCSVQWRIQDFDKGGQLLFILPMLGKKKKAEFLQQPSKTIFSWYQVVISNSNIQQYNEIVISYNKKQYYEIAFS